MHFHRLVKFGELDLLNEGDSILKSVGTLFNLLPCG